MVGLKKIEQGCSPTPVDILLGILSQIHSCQDELRIKFPLEYLQVYIGEHPFLPCFYNHEPY